MLEKNTLTFLKFECNSKEVKQILSNFVVIINISLMEETFV